MDDLTRNESYKELYSNLIHKGETETAKYLQEMLGTNLDDSKNFLRIPNFSNIVDSNRDKRAERISSHEKQRLFRKSFLKEKDIKIILDELNYPNQTIIPRDKIDFQKLSNEIGEYKCHTIFSSDVLDYFTNKKSNNFNSKKYVKFLSAYSQRKVCKLQLMKCDPYLIHTVTNDTLRSFFERKAKKIEALQALYNKSKNFFEYYFEIILSIFFFFLSPIYESKCIDIYDLLSSKLFDQFICMDKLPRQTNPLTIKNTREIYYSFIKLDSEEKGLLIMKDIKKIDNYIFTDVFTSRVFQVFQLYQEKLDIYLFIYLLLSIRNISKPNGTKLFFKFIDLDEKGWISQSDILFFYKGLIKEIDDSIDNHSFDHFLAELYDIVGCSNNQITLDDIVKSKQQNLFFKLLIDINTFKQWELNQDDEFDDEEVEE
ncbi:Serine/threonine-protein phosphatase 2A regulatory subunit B'' subunit gamma [Tritrichomonas musculus]|uniref:Serine/threonine-protein phosphatase 2A regulatory subunit B'' subunit gamma n=1 Tax=Tritrichomonas musculus TaxID=1915356 RepID=A0ABR2K6H7_9EUKA